jgi:hypothetical protein
MSVAQRIDMQGPAEFSNAAAPLGRWRITPLRVTTGSLPPGPAPIDGPESQVIFGVSVLVRYATYHRQGGPLDAVVLCSDGETTLIARITADRRNVRVEEAPDAAEWTRKLGLK